MKKYIASIEVPDNYKPRFKGKNQNVDFYFEYDNGLISGTECFSTEMIEEAKDD